MYVAVPDSACFAGPGHYEPMLRTKTILPEATKTQLLRIVVGSCELLPVLNGSYTRHG